MTADKMTASNATTARFFGWRVVGAAFTVAVFGWGVGFYGPPVFLYAVHQSRGWPVSLISAVVTCHFLLGALVVANLARLHQRFGLVAVTRAGALATPLGFLGWASAEQPWQLFAATLVSGAGWATINAAAINAMISPWFARRRPAALSTAYNGGSIGGVVFSPLWVALIAGIGFTGAVALVGAAMVAVLWFLAGRYFGASPAAMGLAPDGDVPAAAPPPGTARASVSRGTMLRDGRFRTLAAATSLGLFAQIGLIAHLFSLLIPALGSAAAGNYALQACGSGILLAAGGANIPLLVLGVLLFGLGLGNATSLPPLIAQQDFTPAETARAVALVTAFSQASYDFAPAAFGALRDLLPPAAGMLEGHAPALFAAAALVQFAAVAMLLVGRR